MSQDMKVTEILGINRAGKPAASLVGEMSKLVGVENLTVSNWLRRMHATELKDVSTGPAMYVAGAAAGGILWKQHRFLGVIMGGSIGRNGPALMRSDERKYAMANLGQTGGGVVGAMMFPNHPVVGFVLGWAAAGFVVGGMRK